MEVENHRWEGNEEGEIDTHSWTIVSFLKTFIPSALKVLWPFPKTVKQGKSYSCFYNREQQKNLLFTWTCGSHWQCKSGTSASLVPLLVSLCVYPRGHIKLLHKLAGRMDRASLVEVQHKNMVEALPF